MINMQVARRYADALFTLAQEKQLIDRVEADLKLIAQVVKEDQKLQEVLANQLIPVEEKKHLAEAAFSQHILLETMNFLRLTIDKRRENYWVEMAQEFAVLANNARNLSTAYVTSAVEMKREDVQALEKKLSKLTGKNIKAIVAVDPTILGGLVVKIGDEVMDGSVQKRLDILKSNLKGINFTVSGVN
ncbi:MAG: ATP synthase F1 subunit delta [Bacillota bacterium]|nr:ATP synthase F1 subunit delta [Bacillota bacterium]